MASGCAHYCSGCCYSRDCELSARIVAAESPSLLAATTTASSAGRFRSVTRRDYVRSSITFMNLRTGSFWRRSSWPNRKDYIIPNADVGRKNNNFLPFGVNSLIFVWVLRPVVCYTQNWQWLFSFTTLNVYIFLVLFWLFHSKKDTLSLVVSVTHVHDFFPSISLCSRSPPASPLVIPARKPPESLQPPSLTTWDDAKRR